MAKIAGAKSEELRKYLHGAEHFWNISASVGWGCPNNWEDVMLLQYMMSAAWTGEGGLVCDGIFGPKTAAVIKNLQSVQNSEVKVDGRVSVVDGTQLRSNSGKNIYFIYWMNAEIKRWMPRLYLDLKSDQRMPAELRAVFSSQEFKTSGLRGHPQTLVN